MTDEDQPVFTLHRYFSWASILRSRFRDSLKGEIPLPADLSEEDMWRWLYNSLLSESGMFMSLWFSALFVVCEGWKDLRLSDPTIDALLTSPHLNLLRLFRNGAFHFQKDYFDQRTRGFLADMSAPIWAGELTEAFQAWFDVWVGERTQV